MEIKKITKVLLPLLIISSSLKWEIIILPVIHRGLAFMISEIVIVLLFMLQVYKTKKSNGNLIENKLLRYGVIAFTIYCLAVTGYHIISGGFNMMYFDYPRHSLEFIMLCIIITTKDSILDRKSFFTGIMISIGFLAVSQLIVFYYLGNIRSSTVAVNVNIFNCLAVLTLPTIFERIFFTVKRYERYFLIIFSAVLQTLVLLSGSRTSSILLLIIYGVYFIKLMFMKKFKKSLVFIPLIVVTLLSCGVFYETAQPAGKNALYRSFGIIRKVPSSSISGSSANDVREKADAAFDDGSDNLRKLMYEKGIKEASKNPLIGTGIVTFDFQMGGRIVHQSPHNFLIEGVLGLGIIGLILFFWVIAYIIFEDLTKKELYKKWYHGINDKLVVILTLAFLLAFSVTQPTMLSRIVLFTFAFLAFAQTKDLKIEDSKE